MGSNNNNLLLNNLVNSAISATNNYLHSTFVGMGRLERTRASGNGIRNRGGWSREDNEGMVRVCRELESYSLTITMLEQALGDRNFIYAVHGAALIYFITGESPLSYGVAFLDESSRLTPQEALREINGLNAFKVTLLIKLYSFGLRGEHLIGTDDFGMGHDQLLTYLIKEQNIPPLEAIQQVNGLSSDDAWNIWKQQTSSRGVSNYNSRN